MKHANTSTGVHSSSLKKFHNYTEGALAGAWAWMAFLADGWDLTWLWHALLLTSQRYILNCQASDGEMCLKVGMDARHCQ